jgi:hypothetical protein
MSATQDVLYVCSGAYRKFIVALSPEDKILWTIEVDRWSLVSMAATGAEIWVAGLWVAGMPTGVTVFDARDGTFLASTTFDDVHDIVAQGDAPLSGPLS